MALRGRSHHPHSLNEETEAQSNVTSCPEITTPLSEVKSWESKDMAREGWREALPESQRPRPGDHKGPPRSLPQPPSAAEQSCCHKKPGLALGPDPLQTHPPSTVPFSSTDGPNSTHPPNPPPPENYPSILLSLPGTSRPTHRPMFVVSFHNRPSHWLFSWSVGHIIRKSSSKRDFRGQISLGNTKKFLFFPAGLVRTFNSLKCILNLPLAGGKNLPVSTLICPGTPGVSQNSL